ncbi:Ent-kaur-16-ene synthase, chloroplastic [Linum perenne]
MVPSPANSLVKPCFPECVNWILDNQRDDGSWGHNESSNLLVKDTMSSTLASILALKSWGVGDEQIHNGLRFMERNSVHLNDPTQQTPIGFDVTFPAMIQTSVKDFNLNLPLNSADVDAMIGNRESILNNSTNPHSKGRNAYLAYISEGIGDLQDWETAMKFQRSNGSLFNSPSATAAAFIHLQDPDSLRYLRSVVAGDTAAVPSIYPNRVHSLLSLIDTVTSLGIDHHFRDEIKLSLDEIYRMWEQGEEEIFLDCTTCAMSFRILRLYRYPVSPDALGRYTEDRFTNDTMEGYLKDGRAVLELHKASSVCYPEEQILEQQQSWTRRFLVEELDHNCSENANRMLAPQESLLKQVRNAVNYPFRADLRPLATMRNIEEQCFLDNKRVMKSFFSCASYGGKDFVKLAVEDFNSRQTIYSRELKHLMLWLEDKKIDQMRFAKMKTGYCYFIVVAIISDPELSDARAAFTKYAVLASLVDDLFDLFGTPEELLNLVDLFQRWDVNGPITKTEFSSERVETLYRAIYDTICETVEKALPIQGRSVMDHLVELWLDMLKAMLKEAEWRKPDTVPTLDEYLTNGTSTITIGAFFVPTLYLSKNKLSKEVVTGPQFRQLLKVTSVCGRLLNDIRSFQREAEQGEMNAVLLLARGCGGDVGEAIEVIESSIKELTQELLRLTMNDDDEEQGAYWVPEQVKDMFWELLRSLHMCYHKEDLYHSSTKLVKVVESVINEPISTDSNV